MEFFSVQKGGPPKIGGPVRPNSSNMPKAGPECLNRWIVFYEHNFTTFIPLPRSPPEFHIIQQWWLNKEIGSP